MSVSTPETNPPVAGQILLILLRAERHIFRRGRGPKPRQSTA
jgi:hypothetical protein